MTRVPLAWSFISFDVSTSLGPSMPSRKYSATPYTTKTAKTYIVNKMKTKHQACPTPVSSRNGACSALWASPVSHKTESTKMALFHRGAFAPN